MKLIVLIVFLTCFVSKNSAYYAPFSSYHTQDNLGHYSYGYSEPNSKKFETRSSNGLTHGGYSYVDGNGLLQSVSYTADPHHGFQVAGTNLPKSSSNHINSGFAYASYAPLHNFNHLTAHGVPIDTPEVQKAKAEHFAAHAAARSGHHLKKRSLWGGQGYASSSWSGHGGYTPIIHNGVPVDTPEVQLAKAEHFAAHSKALSGIGSYGGGSYGGYKGGYHIPIIQNGVPVDTPEVQHARAAHFAALAAASHGSYNDGSYGGSGGQGYYAPAYKGPIHIPIIQNGVPVDTPEVQYAKAAHLAAVAQAKGNSWSQGSYNGGHYQKW